MAAIVLRRGVRSPRLHAHLARHCRPMRARCSCASAPIDVTGTFKQKKVDLVREGFNPAATSDPIYFNDPQANAFVPLDPGFYRRIENGEIRL